MKRNTHHLVTSILFLALTFTAAAHALPIAVSVTTKVNDISDTSTTGAAASYVADDYNYGLANANVDGTSSLISYSYIASGWNTEYQGPKHIGFNSEVTQTATVTNDTAGAVNLDFDFHINRGMLSLYGPFLGEGGTAAAGYSAEIWFNGIKQWESSVTMSAITAVWDYNLASTGTEIGSYVNMSSPGYSWDDFYGTLNLGTLNSGASGQLHYVLRTFMDLNLTEGAAAAAYASLGDPNAFGASPISNATLTSSPLTQVSEPQGLLLFALGGLGILFQRRRATKAA